MKLSALGYYIDFMLALTLMPITAVALSFQSAPTWLASACLLFALWTFAEYWVHRILYHRVSFLAHLHGSHHSDPDALIGAPPLLTICLLLLLVPGPLFVLGGIAFSAGGSFGALAGYAAYTIAHHAAHFCKPDPVNPIFALQVHHLRHHHAGIDGNFGVSTTFWDSVFRTRLRRPRVRWLG